MDLDAIKQLLEQTFLNAEIELSSEGNHLHLTVVSDEFDGLSSVKKQQKVYAVLNEKIASGEVHAVHMRLLTFAERPA